MAEPVAEDRPQELVMFLSTRTLRVHFGPISLIHSRYRPFIKGQSHFSQVGDWECRLQKLMGKHGELDPDCTKPMETQESAEKSAFSKQGLGKQHLLNVAMGRE